MKNFVVKGSTIFIVFGRCLCLHGFLDPNADCDERLTRRKKMKEVEKRVGLKIGMLLLLHGL